MAVHDLFPYLHVDDARAALDFYREVFDAEETLRLDDPTGRIGHAEMRLGGTTLMLADEFPEHGITSPTSVGGTSCTMHLHVDDADAVISRAVGAGAEVVMEPVDHFYGERSGIIRDPFGHRWTIGHHIEEVSTAEMQRRYDQTAEVPSREMTPESD